MTAHRRQRSDPDLHAASLKQVRTAPQSSLGHSKLSAPLAPRAHEASSIELIMPAPGPANNKKQSSFEEEGQLVVGVPAAQKLWSRGAEALRQRQKQYVSKTAAVTPDLTSLYNLGGDQRALSGLKSPFSSLTSVNGQRSEVVSVRASSSAATLAQARKASVSPKSSVHPIMHTAHSQFLHKKTDSCNSLAPRLTTKRHAQKHHPPSARLTSQVSEPRSSPSRIDVKIASFGQLPAQQKRQQPAHIKYTLKPGNQKTTSLFTHK